VLREREAANSAPPLIDLDLAKAAVRPIRVSEARALIERYEFLGSMPALTRFCFGIFFDGQLGGAVVYAEEQAENLGVWDRYGFTGKIITLARGCCLPWAPPHAGSKLIRRSMRLLPARYTVVTATVDRAAGKIGVLYQACSFDYVGTMSSGRRVIIRHDGKLLSERAARRRFGTQSVDALGRLGIEAFYAERKARYFAFRGSRAERKRLRQAIAPRLSAYPKRRP
jgi:hypothetical protein